MSEITPEQVRQVLDLDLGENDSGERTVRGYLLRLLRDVWTEGEGFDGKRPFGNSSWDYDLKVPMLKAGLIAGKLDRDGDVEQLDDASADALILAAIAALDAHAEANDLAARLAAAEAVCVLFGWTGSSMSTDRGKALHELWWHWVQVSGVSLTPKDHPELGNDVITELARMRDETRAATLARIFASHDDGEAST